MSVGDEQTKIGLRKRTRNDLRRYKTEIEKPSYDETFHHLLIDVGFLTLEDQEDEGET